MKHQSVKLQAVQDYLRRINAGTPARFAARPWPLRTVQGWAKKLKTVGISALIDGRTLNRRGNPRKRASLSQLKGAA